MGLPHVQKEPFRIKHADVCETKLLFTLFGSHNVYLTDYHANLGGLLGCKAQAAADRIVTLT